LHFLLSVGAGLGCFLAVGFFSRCSSFLADFVLIVGGVLDCVPKLIDWRFSCLFWLVLAGLFFACVFCWCYVQSVVYLFQQARECD